MSTEYRYPHACIKSLFENYTIDSQNEYNSNAVHIPIISGVMDVWIQIESGTTPDIAVYLEAMAGDDPTIDGDWRYSTTITASKSTKIWQVYQLTGIPNGTFHRIKIIGNDGNSSDTIVNVKIITPLNIVYDYMTA